MRTSRKRKARQLRDVAVVLGVEPRPDDVDELDRALFLRARLEQLLFARADRAVLELLFDDLQPFGDLLFVGARAVAPQQELHDIGRHRILARSTSAPGPCGPGSRRRPRLQVCRDGLSLLVLCSLFTSDARINAVQHVVLAIDNDDGGGRPFVHVLLHC